MFDGRQSYRPVLASEAGYDPVYLAGVEVPLDAVQPLALPQPELTGKDGAGVRCQVLYTTRGSHGG